MMIHEITEQAGRYKARKRVGRGPGSGTGKRSGRGQKGAGARSGHSRRYSFEGGQMPYFRRLPKLGFTNAKFRTQFWIVNLGDILKHESFANGGQVNAETLIGAGLVRDTSRDLKILGGMYEGQSLSVKLDVTAERVSGAARKAIEAAGGSVNETGTRRDRVRGIDRNSDDHTPKNQTKKARRRRFQQAKAEAAARGEVLKKK
ncbi:MAG: 50S ribosomal protein L15 [Planctomycetota bacterium]|nr:MAG: 50S ribosomal protein L15 [Planctomycetota bacterium]